MYNQEDEIEMFFREQEGNIDKPEPEPENDPDDGLPSIMRALNEPPKYDSQPSAFPTGGFSPDESEEDTVPGFATIEHGGFHSSGTARYDRHKELQEQLEYNEKISRCTVLSKKYMQMFLILMAGIALNIASTVLTNIASNFPEFYTGARLFMIVIAIGSVVISVLYGMILIGLGNYHLEFKTAGIYYMISSACNAVYNSMTGAALVAFSILGAVFSVLYVLKFAVGMSNSFDNVASYMAVSWETFKKVFSYVYGGIVICTLLCFFPILNILALIALLILSIAAIGVSIWQIALVLRSSNVMKQYSGMIHA
ncbi:MAG: hypothetical protein IK020_12865 [Clostridiales bacterium]|nr:hypothetical protein [Clostridiales bacterium]